MTARTIARHRACLLALMAAAVGCRGGTESPEPGAVLLRVGLAAAAPMPDELRLFVYDDTGTIWSNARFPTAGPLVPQSASVLGTILLQPGTTVGNLRFDLRGLRGGVLADEAVLTVTPSERDQGTFDIFLSAALPSDGDADGVPDPIDDCPAVPDPAQTGCGTDGGAGGSGRGGTAGSAGQPGLAGGGGHAGGAGAGGVTAAGGTTGTGGVNATGGTTGAGGTAGHAGTSGTGGQAGAATGGLAGGGRGGQGGMAAGGPGGQAGAGGQPGTGGQAGGGHGGGAGEGGPDAGTNLPQGAGCQAAKQCGTGFCKDGVCCDTACTDPCNSCATGTCKPVLSGEDAPECMAPMTCNPRGKCVAN